MPGILVGVDGSEHSRRALEWAMHEAASHRVPLIVMSVHPGQIRPAAEVLWALPELPDKSFDPEPLRTALQEMTDAVAKENGETPPEITMKVAQGDPAEELVRASKDAELIVVGSHGRGAFAQLLMGSVSSKLTHHAACPVVVIRGTG